MAGKECKQTCETACHDASALRMHGWMDNAMYLHLLGNSEARKLKIKMNWHSV